MAKRIGQRGAYGGHICRKYDYKYSLKRAGKDVTACSECGAIKLSKPVGWGKLLGDLGVR